MRHPRRFSSEILPRLAIAGLFLAAALPKLRDPAAFVVAVDHYRLFPTTITFAVGMMLPWLELVVAIAMPSSGPPSLLVWIGFGLSAVGLTVEALADWQMTRFRRQRRSPGEVMDRGLWRYSRHPNYFGEMLVQWGLYLMACDTGLIGMLTIFAPALLSAMIIGPNENSPRAARLVRSRRYPPADVIIVARSRMQATATAAFSGPMISQASW